MNKYNRLLIVIIVLLLGVNVFFIVDYLNSKNDSKVIVNNIEVSGVTTDLTKVVDDNKSSIVSVVNSSNTGSGFIYKKSDDKLYILTAYHVLDKDNNTVVLSSGAKLKGSIKGYDALLDLAVLEVESDLSVKTVKLGDSSVVKKGEFIVSIGTPTNIDYAGSVELGIISNNNITLLNAIEFNKQKIEYYASYIQISGNIKEGYSGSAIINMNSEVIGMCLMEDNGSVFVSPINEIEIVTNKIINDEEYSKINLGIKGNLVSNMENYEKASLNIPLDVVSGLFVKDVLHDTLGDLMGIKTNDVILSINNREIDNENTLLEILYSNSKDIKVKVLRNNEEIELSSVIYD